jgi:hypothetical protein
MRRRVQGGHRNRSQRGMESRGWETEAGVRDEGESMVKDRGRNQGGKIVQGGRQRLVSGRKKSAGWETEAEVREEGECKVVR